MRGLAIGKDEADNDLLRAMKDWNERGGLAMVLEGLTRRTAEVIARNPARDAEIRLISGYLAEIRHHLVTLSRLPAKSNGPCPLPRKCGDLAESFFELEGRVKELRNDLARSCGRTAGEGWK